MTRVPLPHVRNRVPSAESEARLDELRRLAEQGALTGRGVTPEGAPFPQATPQTGYYGVPLLKEPQWSTEVPIYLFVGGAAGAAAVVATVADLLTKDRELVRSARWVAAVGGMVSPALLVADLGVPSRFLNMLRVFKPQSTMNMGAWTLVSFSSVAAASAFANFLRPYLGDAAPLRIVEDAAGLLASATGLVLSTYTGVLIGATAIPVWNYNLATLPHHFAASGVNCAVSILELMGHEESRALNFLGLAASAYEVYQGIDIETKRTRENEPLQKGLSGAIVRTGGVLSGPAPVALRLLHEITGNGKLLKAAAWSSIIGSLLTRFGWIKAGQASARDHRIPLELPREAPEIRKSSRDLAQKVA